MQTTQAQGGNSKAAPQASGNKDILNPSNIAAEQNKGHTILLMQFTNDDSSRTFLDYEDISKCVDGLCQLYEQKLKVQHPDKADVTYDVSELFSYLDELRDIGAMVYNVNTKSYEPKGRDWIKSQIFNGLKRQAS